jgi:hypothetical protein
MHHKSTMTRAAVAALAIVLASAPAAIAQSVYAPPSSPHQDLRSPDARDAAERPSATGGGLAQAPNDQSARAQAPQPVHQASTDDSDNGTPWAIIGLAVAGAGLAAGATGVAGRTRRARVPA